MASLSITTLTRLVIPHGTFQPEENRLIAQVKEDEAATTAEKKCYQITAKQENPVLGKFDIKILLCNKSDEPRAFTGEYTFTYETDPERKGLITAELVDGKLTLRPQGSVSSTTWTLSKPEATQQ